MKTKEALITDILQAIKFGGGHVTGEIWLSLVFADIEQLRMIAQELNVKI